MAYSKVRVNIKKIIQFFDGKPKDSLGHATSIIAIAGEDLGAGLFKHYIEKVKKLKAEILPNSVTTGSKKGKRLDKWIKVSRKKGNDYILQAEIKNWSAHSLGIDGLSLEATPEEIKLFKIKEWNRLWDNKNEKPNEKSVSKVLIKMKIPQGINLCKHEPLLIYWAAIHPKGGRDPLFFIKLNKKQYFKRLWIFSMSSYLRSLKKDDIQLEMPSIIKRLIWLRDLFNVTK